jgi:hypothetical protein
MAARAATTEVRMCENIVIEIPGKFHLGSSSLFISRLGVNEFLGYCWILSEGEEWKFFWFS